MKKMIVSRHIRGEGLAILKDNVDMILVEDKQPETFKKDWADTNGIILWGGKCDRKDIETAPRLEVIATIGVGFEKVDVEAATERGIPVAISAGANAISVAELAMGLILSLIRRTPEGDAETRAGNAVWFGKYIESSFEVYGKTLGLIGLGNIGKKLGKIAEGFEMKVIGYDPFVKKEEIEALGWEYCADYTEVLKKADVVSIHVPLSPATRDLITMKDLKLMKPTAVIVNTARGGIINEDDLADALNDGIIAGAALDVFVNEPPAPDRKILHAKNLVAAPHNGAQTTQAMVKMAQMCATAVLAILGGEKWPYVANPEVYNHPKWAGKGGKS